MSVRPPPLNFRTAAAIVRKVLSKYYKMARRCAIIPFIMIPSAKFDINVPILSTVKVTLNK